MKKILLALLLICIISGCTKDEITIKTVTYDGAYYDYMDLNYFLEKHGYIGTVDYLTVDNKDKIFNSSTSSLILEDRTIEVTFLSSVRYDLTTMPVEEDASCEIKKVDYMYICDISKDYIQVDNMLFEKKDEDIAAYIKDQGMKEYVIDESPEYDIYTIDNFLELLKGQDIDFKVNDLSTDIKVEVPITNVEYEKWDMARCVEIITDDGRFNLYQLFEDPYDTRAAYALMYHRFVTIDDTSHTYYDLGIPVDNLILEVISEDQAVIDLFRAMNW